MPTKPLVLNETVSATNTLLASIAENLAAIAAADSSNARLASLAKEIADEAKTVAMGATRAEVFDTTELMQNWLKDPENAGKLKVGDNLYIKDTNVPDYWVSNVLTTPNDEGYYYEYAQLEIGKVNLSNVVKTDADDADTVDSVFGMLEGTPKNISSKNLASVVAGNMRSNRDFFGGGLNSISGLSMNGVVNQGCYFVNGGTVPDLGCTAYGVLLCFQSYASGANASFYIAQVFIHFEGLAAVRTKKTDNWGAWKKFTLTT